MSFAIRDDAWLEQRQQFLYRVGLCLVTARVLPLEVAHIRYPDAWFGKNDAGMALKPGHQWTVPLSVEMHREQHSMSEKAWWRSKGFDPADVALSPLTAAAVLTQFELTGNVDGAREWIARRAQQRDAA